MNRRTVLLLSALTLTATACQMLFGEELGDTPCEWPGLVDTVLDVPWTAAESPTLVSDREFDLIGPENSGARVCLVRTEWPADDPTARSDEIVEAWKQNDLFVDMIVGRESDVYVVRSDDYMVFLEGLTDSAALEVRVRLGIGRSVDVLRPALDSVPPPADERSDGE